MRAARYSAFGAAIDIGEVPDPEVPADGVVVRVEATGVCRSDWHAWRGDDDDVTVPHVPGHEFAGTVLEVGSAVRRIRTDMRVAVPFILGCGACSECAAGNAQRCPHQLQPGFHLPGSFAEYVALPRADFNLVPLPDAIPTDAAACLGCRYTTAWRGLVQQGRLRSGERVAVFGCGGVGLAAIQIAQAMDANVAAIDPAPEARARAEMFGAVPHAAATPELSGTDLALDAIGHPTVTLAALDALRPGGRLVQVGILEDAGAATVPLNRIMRNELQIIGSHGMAAAGFPELLELVAADRLDPAALITDRVDLDGGVDHLQHLPDRPGRVVVVERMR